MKEREVKKRCPVCRETLLMYKETSNNGKGELIRKECWSCEKCGETYIDEKDVISTITKEILPAKLLEGKIRKNITNSRISDNETRNIASEIANDFF